MPIFKGPNFTTMYKIWIFLFASCVLISACSNDVDINDDWQEQAVIYALLDPTDSIQEVRVQKTFLGQGDVYEMSTINDSIYYTDSIQVSIQTLEDGNPTGTEIMLVPQSISKVSGDFTTDDHIIYVTENLDGVLDRDFAYRVKVKNIDTGYEAYGDTYLVGEFYITKPQSPTINFMTTVKMEMEWKHAEYSGVYQMIMRFHYEEDGVMTYLDMPFNQREVGTDYNNPGVTEQFEINRFYSHLEKNIEPSFTKKRIAKGVELFLYSGGDNYTLYTNLSESSGSLVEERPEFTNVINGAGLVSSRAMMTSANIFANNPVQDYYLLANAAIDSLVCGYRTADLHFGKIEVLPSNAIDTIYCFN